MVDNDFSRLKSFGGLPTDDATNMILGLIRSVILSTRYLIIISWINWSLPQVNKAEAGFAKIVRVRVCQRNRSIYN